MEPIIQIQKSYNFNLSFYCFVLIRLPASGLVCAASSAARWRMGGESHPRYRPWNSKLYGWVTIFFLRQSWNIVSVHIYLEIIGLKNGIIYKHQISGYISQILTISKFWSILQQAVLNYYELGVPLKGAL